MRGALKWHLVLILVGEKQMCLWEFWPSFFFFLRGQGTQPNHTMERPQTIYPHPSTLIFFATFE